MSAPLIGMFISGALACFFTLLFQYEKKQHTRFLKNIRIRFDSLVERLESGSIGLKRHLSTGPLRQIIHFVFNELLSYILRFLAFCERRIQGALRANRMHARKSRTVRVARNKLDEIAEHKVRMALTEEEKKRHKEDSLG